MTVSPNQIIIIIIIIIIIKKFNTEMSIFWLDVIFNVSVFVCFV